MNWLIADAMAQAPGAAAPAGGGMGTFIMLGAMFVMLQGREWVGLLAQGLTMYSSGLGAFFYLIVGVHAIHAVAALIGLGVAWQRLKHGSLTPGFFLGHARPALFVGALAARPADGSGRRTVYDAGAQVDLSLTVLHRLDMTLSFGYAAGFEDGRKVDDEWMLSLKIL